MANLDLTKYGITGTTEIVHNPSYEMLFEEETKPELTGYEKGQVTELGAVNVMTGVYTGRSPKDKYIVMDENSKDTVWWTSDEYKNDNHPMTEATWATVKDIAKKSCATSACLLLMLSAAPTRIPAWLSASSWRWPGRHTLSPTCLSSPPLRSWLILSLTSLFTTPPRLRLRTTRNWA